MATYIFVTYNFILVYHIEVYNVFIYSKATTATLYLILSLLSFLALLHIQYKSCILYMHILEGVYQNSLEKSGKHDDHKRLRYEYYCLHCCNIFFLCALDKHAKKRTKWSLEEHKCNDSFLEAVNTVYTFWILFIV